MKADDIKTKTGKHHHAPAVSMETFMKTVWWVSTCGANLCQHLTKGSNDLLVMVYILAHERETTRLFLRNVGK